MKRSITIWSTILLFFSVMLVACGNNEVDNEVASKSQKSDTLTVYTTIYPLADFTQKIGGSHVEVESIYPPNVDAHSYELSSKDMVKIADADLFVFTGIGFEGFADKAEKALSSENVTLVKAAEDINLLEGTDSNHEESDDHDGHSDEQHVHHDEDGNEEEHGHEEDPHGHEDEEGHAHSHGDVDPHVWLDPILSIDLAEKIKDALVAKMPEQEEEFEQNFIEVKAELEKLDQEFSNMVEGSQSQYLIVSHDAYGYWEERYGITMIPIAGLSPTQEPSQKQLTMLIEEAKKHHIRYVLFEQNTSTKVAEMIQTEIGAESLHLHNLEAMTEEDLAGKEDYFSIMRKNIETVKTALN